MFRDAGCSFGRLKDSPVTWMSFTEAFRLGKLQFLSLKIGVFSAGNL